MKIWIEEAQQAGIRAQDSSFSGLLLCGRDTR